MSGTGARKKTSNGLAAPSSASKGKGRSVSTADFLDDHGNDDLANSDAFQDYDSALDSVLAEDGVGGNGRDTDHVELELEEEEEERFVYDGLDDEDTQQFRRDANLDHKSYQEQLRGVLEGELDDEAVPDHADGSSTVDDSDLPNSRFSTPIPLQDLGSPRSVLEPIQSPTFSGYASPISASSANLSLSSDLPNPRQGAAGTSPSVPRYLQPRRPPMNPLISRLRSTSGVPSLTPSSSLRSISHSSSLASFRDFEGLNGFANDSPNSSFIHASKAEVRFNDNASLTSSNSQLNGIHASPGQPRASRMSPSPSDFYDSPDTTSPAPSVSLRIPKPTPVVLPFRWTRLHKITQRLSRSSASSGGSSVPSATFGEPTAMAASGIICLGTSKGWCVVFDYSQSLLCVCGNEQIAKAAGSVTSVAISSDQTFVAVGHATGFIYLYALAKPQVPARVVQPVTMQAVQQGKAEGHLAGNPNAPSRILHLGFVGSRHTAIVSGDSNGLAFYHSLGKVLGLANTDVLRILGKYPTPGRTEGAPQNQDGRRANSLLGMQPLPLGTQAHVTDDYSLVALLTGVKLVVVGLKPTARTCWRALNKVPMFANGHASLAQAEDANIGALAWLPSIDGKEPLLAFSWYRELRAVRVEQEVKSVPLPGHKSQETANGKTRDAMKKEGISKSLRFRPFLLPGAKPTTSEEDTDPVYTASEPILAIQWLNSRSILFQTSTHLEVFDIQTLQRTERVNLQQQSLSLSRSISMDQSLRTYKGRIFLSTSAGLCVGTLLSWADRILQLVDTGDLVSAIDLTVAYYDGTALSSDGSLATANSIIGLPADAEKRKVLVGSKLREILIASMEYVFSEDRMRDATHIDPAGRGRGVDRTSLFQSLVDSSVRACLAIQQFDFLFDDLWERYISEGIDSIFLDRLEPFVLEDLVQSLPTTLVQRLLQRHEDQGEFTKAESLIRHLKPECLDVNQAAGLCSRHRLYDALIYVYNAALSDFVGPLVELLQLIKRIQHNRKQRPRWVGDDERDADDPTYFDSTLESEEALIPDAYKVYSYLADTLVGLSHPSKEPLSDAVASDAKISLYSFLFSGRPKAYPEGGQNLISTVEDNGSEPTYPYLRLLLRFDAEAMLDCLDIALEDPYLNEEASGRTPDRQQILNLLLDVMGSPSTATTGDFTAGEKTFLNIFIARSLPKYSQFVQLAQPTLEKVLWELAADPDLSTQEDRQLAAEYLLSAYTPTYDEKLLQALEDAGFYRLLAHIYRSKRLWRKLASMHIRDIDQGTAVFEHLGGVLRDSNGEERAGVVEEILDALPQLVEIGVGNAAQLVETYLPEQHGEALTRLDGSELRQLAYLRSLLDPEETEGQDGRNPLRVHGGEAIQMSYISLLSEHDPERVVAYLAKTDGIDYRKVIAICREKEAYPAVIWCQAEAGVITDSIDTLRDVLESRFEILGTSLLKPSFDIRVYLAQIVESARMAIRICAEQTDPGQSRPDMDEVWYQLLSVLLDLVRNTSANVTAASEPLQRKEDLRPLADLVPQALSSLISSTSSRTLSFPRLVRRLMDSTSNNPYVQYRDIIDSMLDTYRFENDLLSTSNRLVQIDLHQHVADLEQERGTGWRPSVSGLCEACGKPVWAQPEETERYSNPDLVLRSSSGLEVSEKLKGRPTVRRRPSLKGKEASWLEEEPAVQKAKSRGGGSIVVFRGGAACHAVCLQRGDGL